MPTATTSSALVLSEQREQETIKARLAAIEDGYCFEEQGLYVARPLTDKEWRELGRVIVKKREPNEWALGDWLVAGRMFQTARMKEAAKITGYSITSLLRHFHVSKDFPREERVKYLGLRWAHFVAVHPLMHDRDRVKMLKLAMEERLNAGELEDRIEHLYPVVGLPNKGRPSIPFRRTRVSPKVKCPHCSTVFPVRGNKA